MNFKCCCFSTDHSYIRNFIRRCSSRRRNRKIVILLVGLDNAGKSTTALRLANDPVDRVLPTMGFNLITLRYQGHDVILYDLGGSPQIRDIWTEYFAAIHGIIFVVDSSDRARLDENRKVLAELLAHEKLAGKPLLFLANKQDKEGALDHIDIVEELQVERLVNEQQCRTQVETCSAVSFPTGSYDNIDPSITNGYRWLLRHIINDFDALDSRVRQDSEQQQVKMEAARQEWKLKHDKIEQQLEGEPAECNGDPFRPIHFLVPSEHSELASSRPSTSVSNVANGHVRSAQGSHPSRSHSARDRTDSSSHSGRDSPDSSSHSVRGSPDSSRHIYIPLHSPSSPSEPAEPNIIVVSERPLPIDLVTAVKEQFKLKMQRQQEKKQKRFLCRFNRTAPASATSEGRRRASPVSDITPWARPLSAKSLPSQAWCQGRMTIEEVDPPSPLPARSEDSVVTQVVRAPADLALSDSDDNDVVIFCNSHK